MLEIKTIYYLGRFSQFAAFIKLVLLHTIGCSLLITEFVYIQTSIQFSSKIEWQTIQEFINNRYSTENWQKKDKN